MYISEIELRDVRRFDKQKIKINRHGGSVVIAGDNGAGKTTILRSIAMGLCDVTSAAGLLRELPGSFVRTGESAATIDIELEDRKTRRYRTFTTIKRQKPFEQIEQDLSQKNGRWEKRKQDKFPWKQIFVCGYGAGRHASGTADYDKYRAVDAVYTLFRYYEPLQNPELTLRRIMDEAWLRSGPKSGLKEETRVGEHLLQLVRRILNIKDRLKLRGSGIRVKRPRGDTDIRSSGDGYSAMATLVLDLINWYMQAVGPNRILHIINRGMRRRVSDRSLEASGIVLIDEIEQHLHPVWQIQIMHLLTSTFPKLQFIVTTHSPLVQSGCAGLQLVNLAPQQPEARSESPSVYGWIAEDVYRNMGLASTRAIKIQNLLDDFKELHLKSLLGKLSPRGRAKMREITDQFNGIPGMDVTLTSSKLRNIGSLPSGRKKG